MGILSFLFGKSKIDLVAQKLSFINETENSNIQNNIYQNIEDRYLGLKHHGTKRNNDYKNDESFKTKIQEQITSYKECINELSNMYVKLQARGIKEMSVEDGSVLTDDECRVITSAITILEQKVSPILKKK